MYIELPKGVPTKLFHCAIQADHIEVGIRGNPPYLNHDLTYPVKTDSSFWMIENIKLDWRSEGALGIGRLGGATGVAERQTRGRAARPGWWEVNQGQSSRAEQLGGAEGRLEVHQGWLGLAPGEEEQGRRAPAKEE